MPEKAVDQIEKRRNLRRGTEASGYQVCARVANRGSQAQQDAWYRRNTGTRYSRPVELRWSGLLHQT